MATRDDFEKWSQACEDVNRRLAELFSCAHGAFGTYSSTAEPTYCSLAIDMERVFIDPEGKGTMLDEMVDAVKAVSAGRFAPSGRSRTGHSAHQWLIFEAIETCNQIRDAAGLFPGDAVRIHGRLTCLLRGDEVATWQRANQRGEKVLAQWQDEAGNWTDLEPLPERDATYTNDDFRRQWVPIQRRLLDLVGYDFNHVRDEIRDERRAVIESLRSPQVNPQRGAEPKTENDFSAGSLAGTKKSLVSAIRKGLKLERLAADADSFLSFVHGRYVWFTSAGHRKRTSEVKFKSAEDRASVEAAMNEATATKRPESKPKATSKTPRKKPRERS